MNAKISKNLRRNGVFNKSQNVSPQIIVDYKKKNSYFIVENPGRHYLNQKIKVNITGNGMTCVFWYHVLRGSRHPCGLLPKVHAVCPTMRKYQTDPNWRTISKIPDQYSSKVVKIMKNKERLRELWRPVETKDTWQLKAYEMQDLIQDQKKDIHEKTETQESL